MRSAGRNAGALVPLSVLLSCCCCGTSCWQEQVFSGFLLKRKSQALSPVECKTPAPHVGPDTELHSFRASRQGALAQCRSLRCLPGEGAVRVVTRERRLATQTGAPAPAAAHHGQVRLLHLVGVMCSGMCVPERISRNS